MEGLIGSAIYVVTNPFESAGKFASDPVGSVSETVGMGITGVTDFFGHMLEFGDTTVNTVKTNPLGYTLAMLLVAWIGWTGFQPELQSLIDFIRNVVRPQSTL